MMSLTTAAIFKSLNPDFQMVPRIKSEYHDPKGGDYNYYVLNSIRELSVLLITIERLRHS